MTCVPWYLWQKKVHFLFRTLIRYRSSPIVPSNQLSAGPQEASPLLPIVPLPPSLPLFRGGAAAQQDDSSVHLSGLRSHAAIQSAKLLFGKVTWECGALPNETG